MTATHSFQKKLNIIIKLLERIFLPRLRQEYTVCQTIQGTGTPFCIYTLLLLFQCPQIVGILYKEHVPS